MKKRYIIAISIVAIILIGVAIAGVWYFATINCIKKEYAPNEVVIGEGEKQALVIYEPSKHDTTKNVSMIIANTLAEEGYTVSVNYPSSNLTYNWEDYDIIAFGSPVYVGEVSPVLKSYVESNPITDKNILIYATGMVPEETKELVEMASWVKENNSIVSVKVTKEEGEKLISFIRESLNQWRIN